MEEEKGLEGKYRIIFTEKNMIIRAKGRNALVPFCRRSCGHHPDSLLRDKGTPLSKMRMLAGDLQMNFSLRTDLSQREPSHRSFMFPVRQPTSND